MEKEVIQIGNSLAVIIPKAIAQKAGLRKGSVVNVTEAGSKVQINKVDAVTPVRLRGVVSSRGATFRDFARARKNLHKQFFTKWKKF